jgi:hypothetical protein
MRGRRQYGRQLAGPKRGGQIIDECRSSREEGVEAILNRAVGNGDRQVRFPATGFAGQDQRATFSDEIGRERGAQHLQAQRRLVGEIEIMWSST